MTRRGFDPEKQRLEAGRRMHSAAEDLAGRADQSILTIARLRPRLMNYLYCLSHAFELSPRVYSTAEKDRLIASARLSGLRLEDALEKVTIVAAATGGTLSSEPSFRSLRSLTHESMIYAGSLFPATTVNPYPLPSIDDLTVVVDAQYLSRLLSSCICILASSPKSSEVSVSVESCCNGRYATAVWRISSSKVAENTERSRTLRHHQHYQAPGFQITLEHLFIEIIAHVLSSRVRFPDSRSVEVLAQLPLVRDAENTAETSPSNSRVNYSILVIDPTPAHFTPIGMPQIHVAKVSGLRNWSAKKRRGVLVLHYDRSRDSSVDRNLEACRVASIPVLLRASDLNYEYVRRFRNLVDSIVIEPSSPGLLMRQMNGLSTLFDRRSSRRSAELL